MFKHFGFYFPDAQYLKDPEGLLKYLVRALVSTPRHALPRCGKSAVWVPLQIISSHLVLYSKR